MFQCRFHLQPCGFTPAAVLGSMRLHSLFSGCASQSETPFGTCCWVCAALRVRGATPVARSAPTPRVTCSTPARFGLSFITKPEAWCGKLGAQAPLLPAPHAPLALDLASRVLLLQLIVCACSVERVLRALQLQQFMVRSVPPTERPSPGLSASQSQPPTLNPRPEIKQEDPLDLSILLSGGKETNKDSLSNGE